MALTRKFLKAMGIDEEKVDEIIDAHSETVTALKDEISNLKSNETELTELKSQLENYEKNGTEEVVAKSEFDSLKSEYDNYKAEVETKELHSSKEHAFRELLKSVGVNDNRISAIVKISDIDSLEIDKKGNIKNIDELTKNVKEEWADFIETPTTRGARMASPPADNGGASKYTKADIYKKDEHGRYIMSTAERQKALAENPDLL